MSDKTTSDEGDPKAPKRIPETEVALGARIRVLRVASGLSQTALGEVIGVSFQQIQKYERGKDRIAASTLQVLAAALGVHPGSFFDDNTPTPNGDLSNLRIAMREAAGLQRVSDPEVRKRILALIEVLADKLKT